MEKSAVKLLPSSSNSSEQTVINETVKCKFKKMINNLFLNTDKQSVFLGFSTRRIHFGQDHNLEYTDFVVIHQKIIRAYHKK